MSSDKRANISILYVIKSLHGDIFLGNDFILRFNKFIASYDKFASLNIKSYPQISNHLSYNTTRHSSISIKGQLKLKRKLKLKNEYHVVCCNYWLRMLWSRQDISHINHMLKTCTLIFRRTRMHELRERVYNRCFS